MFCGACPFSSSFLHMAARRYPAPKPVVKCTKAMMTEFVGFHFISSCVCGDWFFLCVWFWPYSQASGLAHTGGFPLPAGPRTPKLWTSFPHFSANPNEKYTKRCALIYSFGFISHIHARWVLHFSLNLTRTGNSFAPFPSLATLNGKAAGDTENQPGDRGRLTWQLQSKM